MKCLVLLLLLLNIIPVVNGFVQPYVAFQSLTLNGRPSNQGSRAPQQNIPVVSTSVETTLEASFKDSLDDKNPKSYWDAVRAGSVVAYIALLAFVFNAPGQFGDPADAELIAKIVADPVNPGINPLYYTAFNIFATMPLILASVTCPQASKEGLPPGPFVLASSFIGFFVFGPYLIFRKQPLQQVTRSDLGWVTRNILENKLFGVSTVVFTVLALLAPDAISAYQADPAGTWQGFVDLITSSRFCAVSLFDLLLLYGFIIALTPLDYKLRKPEATDDEAWKVAGLTALLPYLGSAIYMTLRPSIPEEQVETYLLSRRRTIK
ncbi:hypothetical protein ACA910_021690 [Epithemia clementina (nom. ined.)]